MDHLVSPVHQNKILLRRISPSTRHRNLLVVSFVVGLHAPTWAAPVYDTSFVSQSNVAGAELDNTSIREFGPAASYFNDTANPNANNTGVNQLQAIYAPKAVKASASVSGSSSFLMTSYSRVAANYRDWFFLDAIDAFGQPVLAGTFTATANFTGTAEADGNGVYNALATVFGSMSVGNIASPSQRVLSIDGSRALSLPVSISVSWIAGAPIPVFMQAVAEAQGSAGNRVGSAHGSFSAEGDLMSTIAWTGITNVLDSNGNPVESFTALSADGTDYASGFAPVPLPAAAWLFGSAVIGGGMAVHRRKTRRSSSFSRG